MAALDFRLGSRNRSPKGLRIGYLMPDDLITEHWVDFEMKDDCMKFVREAHERGYIIFDLQEIYL